MEKLEAWLSGPIEGVPPLLMPAAHALVQATEDVEAAAATLTVDQLWMRPGGAASVGFHLRHIPGVIDRLLTYARGEMLTDDQMAYLRSEGEPGDPPAAQAELVAHLRSTVDRALDQLRNTAQESLLERREVGRKRVPSNVIGLIFHAAEHAQRHTGQVVATAKIISGSG